MQKYFKGETSKNETYVYWLFSSLWLSPVQERGGSLPRELIGCLEEGKKIWKTTANILVVKFVINSDIHVPDLDPKGTL